MVIVYDVIFGYICMTIFQLTERIEPLVTKSGKEVLSWCINQLGFSVKAIPTRHCVPCYNVPYTLYI